jgi:hypothetical protein
VRERLGFPVTAMPLALGEVADCAPIPHQRVEKRLIVNADARRPEQCDRQARHGSMFVPRSQKAQRQDAP